MTVEILVGLLILMVLYSALPKVRRHNTKLIFSGGFAGFLALPFVFVSLTAFYYTATVEDISYVAGYKGRELYEYSILEGCNHREAVGNVLLAGITELKRL